MNHLVSDLLANKENVYFIDNCDLQESTTYQKPSVNGVISTKNVLNEMEIDDFMDPWKLDYYAEDIYKYLHQIESEHCPKFGYLRQQRDITQKMRAILVDWLIEVHLKFKLAPETLFLGINLIDRYLEVAPVTKDRLQLVGVSAMLIACKYEEIYPPEVKDFVYITDSAYTREEVLQMEASILSALNYRITFPSSFNFLTRYFQLSGLDQKHYNLARYLIELPLIDYNMLRYTPSLVAAAAVFLTCKITRHDPYWMPNVAAEATFTEQELKNCAKDICIMLQGLERSTLQAVKKKFSLSEYGEVGKSQLFWSSVAVCNRQNLFMQYLIKEFQLRIAIRLYMPAAQVSHRCCRLQDWISKLEFRGAEAH